MRKPLCHSARQLAGHPVEVLCAHPNVHAENQIVDVVVCQKCMFRNEAPPPRFRSLLFPGNQPKERGEIEIVVAKYHEDIRWLDAYTRLRTVIYDKSESPRFKPLPNIGREAHTYLHHICENYDRLADTTVFLQGDPSAHVADLHEGIWQLDRDIGFRDLSDHVLVEDKLGRPVHPGLRLDEMYERLFGKSGRDYYLSYAGACFAVSRSNVVGLPQSFYENAMAAVVERPQGPWEIERLWRDIFHTSAVTEGVVTAADTRFFRDLQLLVHSHQQKDRYPLVIFDLGLEATERQWCFEQSGVVLSKLPPLSKPIERIFARHWWQSWLKPFFIFHAPFDRVLWLDADCVIVDDIGRAFQQIESQPLLVRDATTATTENPPQLYEHLPLPKDINTSGINLNAGVVGLCKVRDRALLHAWGYGVGWAAANPDKQHLSAWVDQGILLWACHHTKTTSVIQTDLCWNQPAERAPNLIQSAVKNRRSILEQIRQRYTKAGIVHWLGDSKLSSQLADELAKLFVSGFDD